MLHFCRRLYLLFSGTITSISCNQIKVALIQGRDHGEVVQIPSRLFNFFFFLAPMSKNKFWLKGIFCEETWRLEALALSKSGQIQVLNDLPVRGSSSVNNGCSSSILFIVSFPYVTFLFFLFFSFLSFLFFLDSGLFKLGNCFSDERCGYQVLVFIYFYILFSISKLQHKKVHKVCDLSDRNFSVKIHQMFYFTWKSSFCLYSTNDLFSKLSKISQCGQKNYILFNECQTVYCSNWKRCNVVEHLIHSNTKQEMTWKLILDEK